MTTSVNATATSSPLASKSMTSAFDPAEQKELFLKLLVAQLKNQDPTSPMDQKEMLGQMAQFTTVEQITNMATAMDRLARSTAIANGVGLLGKQVDYLDPEGNPVTGVPVTAVASAGENVELVLGNGSRIKLADVIRVE